jgi:adenosylcobinamide-GDP ribazoletransferase
MLPLAFALPYARSGQGQGRLLGGVGGPTVVLGLAIALLLVLPAGGAGLSAAGAAALATLAFGLVARSRFGGVTGDVLGAAAKLAETAALVVAVAVLA